MALHSNVVVLSLDSLRFDAVGQTDTVSTTPTMDSLLRDGLRFERAYTNGPYTRASMPSIMTGTYPWEYGGFKRLAESRPHLAELVSSVGYTTAGFHSNPYLGAEYGYDRGFDVFIDGEESSSSLSSLRRKVVRRVPRDTALYRGVRWLYKNAEEVLGTDLGTPYVAGETKTGMATEWLQSAEEPFFCWVHYMDPHHPYIPHNGTVSEDIGRKRAIRLRQRMIESPEELADADVDTLKTLYHGELEYVDKCIADLLSTVREADRDTTVLFLADHGEAFGEHNKYGHPDIFYDEVIRIPMSIDAPDVENGTVTTPISCIDVLPTILDYAGCDPPSKCTGESLRSRAPCESEERTVFAHAKERDGDNPTVMACDGRWKLIASATGEPRALYNLAEDPEETENVLENEPKERDRLAAALSDHLAAIDETADDSAESVEMSDDTRNRLEQLGYME